MKILVLDIETTGLSSRKNEILELGMVELDLETGDTKPLFDKVFKSPNLRASDHNAWIFENGFMKIEEVRDAKPISEYQEEIQTMFNKYKYVSAWSSSFDFGFLEQDGFIIKGKLPCPMKTSAEWFAIPNKWGKLGKWASVDEAWTRLFGEETEYKEIHRGYDDAVHEAK